MFALQHAHLHAAIGQSARNACARNSRPDDECGTRLALGAFGLSEEINKRAFIRRILEGGTDSLEAPANRMPDPRWRRFAAVFGYGDIGGAQTAKPGFAPALADQFVKRAFEAAVGDQDEAFRLALNFRREVADIAASSGTDRSGWLKMLGQRPVRAVLEAALGLPASMATLDIDKQVGIVSARARAVFGADSPKAFGDATLVEKTLQRFFARREIEGGGLASSSARGSTALTLLSSRLGAISAPNLVASNTLRR